MIAIEQELVQLHQECAPGLLRYAAAISRDEELARDAVQEAFLKYFVERRLGRAIDNPRGWLYRVLRNHLLDRLSSAEARREVDAAEAEGAAAPSQTDAHLLQAEAARELKTVLTLRELECLRLRAEGLSYEEIGSVLEIRPGTVGALLTRVYRKVRETSSGDQNARRTVQALLFWARGGEAYSC